MKHGLLFFLVFGGVLGVATSTPPTRPVMAQSQRMDSAREQGKPGASLAQGRMSESEPAANDSSKALEEDKPSTASNTGPSLDKTQVTSLRFLSWNGYTRIMLDLSREAQYQVRRLKEDAAKGIPPRIYIDILGARLALASKEPIPVEDGLLRQVRLGQYSGDTVRVVLDMNSLGDHKAFILADPYRLVIDVYGTKATEQTAAKELPTTSASHGRRTVSKASNPSTPPPAVSSGLRKIVLDPGHGGKDPGAVGPGGIAEKDLVLAIAKKLAAKLKKEMGIQVVLTRKDDRFIALEDRTATANSEDADLFISLHMNASPNAEAKGIETYYLDNTTDEAAIRLAARENATSRKNISDLQFILSDMTQNMKLEDSITLAHRVQSSLVSGMTKVMTEVKDLGVKKALFYVLVGARMPSVLVEMFFITNRGEGRAMTQASHQDAMVEALFEGIQKFSQSNLIAKTL